ncbi:MAG: histone H1 [Gemmataceae bacterium]
MQLTLTGVILIRMAKQRKKRTPDPAQFAAGVMNDLLSRIDPDGPKVGKPDDETKNPAAVALGRLGGLKGGPARAKKLGKKKLSQIGKKGAAKRWAKKPT